MNTTYPLRLTNGVLFIDNSSVSMINECFRKGAYGLCLKKKQTRDETALRFGGIIHKGLEARYQHGTTVTPDIQAEMVKAVQAEYLNWEPPMGDIRTLDQAVSCLIKYNTTYPIEDFEILELNGYKGTETPFAVPLAEITVDRKLWVQDIDDPEPVLKYIQTLPVIFTGRIDLLVSLRNGIWLMDHKTTSMGGAGFFSPFYIELQFKGYAWAVKELLQTNKYPMGVRINGIINRKPTRTGKSIEFIRDDIILHECTINEWYHSFLDSIHHFIDCIHYQSFPMQTFNCVTKYGMCEFYDICSLPVAQRPTMLASGNYTDRLWNPITQDNDAEKRTYAP